MKKGWVVWGWAVWLLLGWASFAADRNETQSLADKPAPAAKADPDNRRPAKSGTAKKAQPASAEKKTPIGKKTPSGAASSGEGNGSQNPQPIPDGQKGEFFKTSLHHTGRGLAYWYGKERKGLELLAGQPYEKLACRQCHVESCQGCHQPVKQSKKPEGKMGPAAQETCLKCHDRLAAQLQEMGKERPGEVHFGLGLTCLDCHTAREMHGDGEAYQSQKQPGAMDARCEKCHGDISNSVAHRKHYRKLSCQACHAATVQNLTSTPFDRLAREGKRLGLPERDWVFLVAREGKVTAASLETFVLPEGKTFMRFTPDGSHHITRAGRKCAECHGTPNMQQAQTGSIPLSWLEKGEIKKNRGLIPVAAGVTYPVVFQQWQKGKWIPLEKAEAPVLQIAGYGEPVGDKPLRKMLKARSEESESKSREKKKKKD